MTREQMIDDINRMTNQSHRDGYEEQCEIIGAKFRAAVERHGVKLGSDDEVRLSQLERGKKFVWSGTHAMVGAGVPVLEVWAIVKSTLEGKS